MPATSLNYGQPPGRLLPGLLIALALHCALIARWHPDAAVPPALPEYLSLTLAPFSQDTPPQTAQGARRQPEPEAPTPPEVRPAPPPQNTPPGAAPEDARPSEAEPAARLIQGHPATVEPVEPVEPVTPARPAAAPPAQRPRIKPAPTEAAPAVAKQPMSDRQSRPPATRPTNAARLLASRNALVADLGRELPIEPRGDLFTAQTRRKAVNMNTKDFRYAAYLAAWRRKVEQVGRLNYPDEARKFKLQGSLILQVTLNHQGELQSTSVIRSSGHPQLDQAAIEIVRIASPFAPFPEDIRRETDLLDITRTWTFRDGQQLE